MANGKLIITQRTGENQFNDPGYNSNQISLINSDISQTTIKPTSFFEFHVFTRQGTIPFYSDYSWQNYNITSNDLTPSTIEVDVRKDIQSIESLITFQNITVVYNFFNNLCGTSEARQLIISSISSDRTELILKGTFTNNTDYTFNTVDYINYRANDNQYKDFYLNLSNNRLLLCTNIQIDASDANNPLIFIKLYEPLPDDILNLQTLWLVEKISDSLIFDAEAYTEPQLDITTEFLSGPNININLNDGANASTPFYNKNQLQLTTSSFFSNQISTLISSSGININVDYTDFNNFINYSSPTIRLQNFYLKMSLLEQYNNELTSLVGVPNNSGSVSLYQSRIDEILQNFDGYDKFLYFESGSKSWPKTNSTYPYSVASTGSNAVLTWFGSLDTTSPYYGGELLSASRFDNDNKNYLLYSIPPYLRDDPQNAPYETFVSMMGQHFDNIWIYTKDITNKFDADNRINFGISRDLVSEAIKEFGIKLYQNNFSNTDLFSAFFGVTEDSNPTGFPDVYYESLYYGLGTWGGSIYGPLPSGSEGVRTVISATDDIIPIDDINKRIYKRIYHNAPFLVKSKGTKRGLQALINCFGVPDSILQINEFGGKDKVRENDWDFYRRIYNKALIKQGNDTAAIGTTYAYTSPNFRGLNPKWGVDPSVPRSVEFRFKSRTNPDTLPNCTGLENTPIREELFHTFTLTPVSSSLSVTLEYFGSGSATSSYSGSTFDTNNEYADLTLYISGSSQYYSSSINLPFYNRDWWSVMVQYDSGSNKFNLYTGNKIFNGNDGTRLGFIGSASITVPTYDDTLGYRESLRAFLVPDGSTNRHFGTGKSGSINFSGSIQEYRFWTNLLPIPAWKNHVMNPLSIETGYLTGSLSPTETLAFRTREGEDWSISGSTASPTTHQSIHPKVTGSFNITSSFSSSTGELSLYTHYGEFEGNKEFQFLNQPIAGIKNRINDKVRVENQEFPLGDTLTYHRPLLQNNEASQSFTNHLNYIEVGFSPSNQVNDDIISQLGQLNIGEYIGDPRHRSSSLNYYDDLNNLRDVYFEKYIKNYDVNDFVRLIKYFDNSLFKMIKDFVPLRSSTSTGIIIKQHLLERNRYPQPKADPFTTLVKTPETGSTIKGVTQTGNNSELIFKDITITASISSQPKNFSTGSTDYPIYSTSGSSVYVFNGGTAGLFEPFNGTTNRFGITQSFSKSYATPAGKYTFLHDSQDEFYNGEFSGSNLVVTTQSMNNGCIPFLNISVESQILNHEYDRFIYTPNKCTLTRFDDPSTAPRSGEILFFKESGVNRFLRLKISNTTKTGTNLTDILPLINNITFDFNGTNKNINVSYLSSGPTYASFEVVAPIFNYDTTDTTSNFINYAFSANKTSSLSSSRIPPQGSQGEGSEYFTYVVPIDNYDTETDISNLFNISSGIYTSPLTNNRTLTATGSISGSYQFKNLDSSNSVFYILNARIFNKTRNEVIKQTGYGALVGAGATQTTRFDYTLQDTILSTEALINNDEIELDISIDMSSNTNLMIGTGSLIISSSTFEINQTTVTDPNPVSTITSVEPGYLSDNTDFLHAFDCQPLLNNAMGIRPGTLYMDVDYATGLLNPTNINTITENNQTLEPALTPDSNYSQKSRILNRYLGSKASSARYNYYTPPNKIILSDGTSWGGDISYGKTPVISILKPKFGYFQLLVPTSPEIEGGTQVKLKYIIDQQGNPFKPLLNSPSFFDVEGTFEQGDRIDIALEDTLQTDDTSLTNAAVGINLDNYNISATVLKGARRVDPILTSQIKSIHDVSQGESAFNTDEITFFSETVVAKDFSFQAGEFNPVTYDAAPVLRIYTVQISNPGYNVEGNYDTSTYIWTNPNPSVTDQTPIKFQFQGNVTATDCNGVIAICLKRGGSVSELASSNLTAQNNTVFKRFSFDYDPSATDPILETQQFNNNTLQPGDEIFVRLRIFPDSVNPLGNIVVQDANIYGVPASRNIVLATSSFWSTGSAYDNYLTSSLSIGEFYNFKQAQESGTTFKPISIPFTIQPGDEFRFNGVESRTHIVSDIEFKGGKVIARVDPPVLPSINLDEFLIRRYNPDGTSVLLDLDPPSSSFATTKGIIKNISVDNEIEENIGIILSRLSQEGTI